MRSDWEQEWRVTEAEEKAMELAERYIVRTEAYDRTVCTGPIGRDGILPADHRELRLINMNALQAMKEIMSEASMLGIDRDLMRQALNACYRKPFTAT